MDFSITSSFCYAFSQIKPLAMMMVQAAQHWYTTKYYYATIHGEFHAERLHDMHSFSRQWLFSLCRARARRPFRHSGLLYFSLFDRIEARNAAATLTFTHSYFPVLFHTSFFCQTWPSLSRMSAGSLCIHLACFAFRFRLRSIRSENMEIIEHSVHAILLT